MGEVVSLNGGPVGDGIHLDADTILENNKGEFANLIIAGWGRDGTLKLASTDGVADAVLLLEQAKLSLLMGNVEEE